MDKHYDIIKKIGQGEHGSVYLVKKNTHDKHKKYTEYRDDTEQQLYAMKKIPLSRNSFDFQSKLLLSLNHPNVIKVHETFSDKNHLSLILELAEEGDLHQFIKRNYFKAVPQSIVISWLCQLSLGLHYLHIQNNIIHRDIKLRNILINQNGLIKLADFGVARKLQKGEDFANTSVGTPCYLSPEAINLGKYDSKSDVWSLGCLMYEICSGQKPFQGDSLGVLLHNIVFNQFGEVPNRFSKWIKDLIGQMLQKDPSKRPSIVNILQNYHIKKHFKYLKQTHSQYKKFAYPEQGPKTTKYLDIQDKRLSCLKIFSQSLKTTKNQKSIKLQIQEKNSGSDSSSNNKSEKQTFSKNDLIIKNNRQIPSQRKKVNSVMNIKASELLKSQKDDKKIQFPLKSQISCSLNKTISPPNQVPRKVQRDKFMDKSLKSIISQRAKDKADKKNITKLQ